MTCVSITYVMFTAIIYFHPDHHKLLYQKVIKNETITFCAGLFLFYKFICLLTHI